MKGIIYDEDGEQLYVPWDEYMEFFKDMSEETMRRKLLGHVKSVRRGIKMIEEALTEIQSDSNVEFIIKTGKNDKI